MTQPHLVMPAQAGIQDTAPRVPLGTGRRRCDEAGGRLDLNPNHRRLTAIHP